MMPIEVCDVCGSNNVKEVKCKLICQNCGTILRTCGDLSAVKTSIEGHQNGS